MSEAESSARVRVQVAAHVATVTLSRPRKHNALDAAMFEEIAAAARRLRVEPGVRVVVLHGEGPSFCSGLDLASMAATGDGPEDIRRRLMEGPPTLFQRVSTDWSQVPAPVIAAVHGVCYGGGLQIALGADIRIAAPDARLSVMEIRWGLVPDMGITRSLPRLVGIDVAKELTLTARVLSGEEAARLGLVTRTSEDPLAAAQELAAQIASRSPDAVRAAKRLYDEGWNAGWQDSLGLEAELQRGLIGAPNQLAAVAAAIGAAPAQFTDPS
jgi:enoyl-CoA hydratase/carnithine racemase